MNKDMKQIGVFIIISLCFFSCTHEEVEGNGPGGNSNILTLTYTIPDAIAVGGTTRAVNYVEATAQESTVNGLHLLFFNSDSHGNGTFVATATATLKDASLKQNSITVTLPPEVNTANEYAVLVIANLANYMTASGELTAYLAGFQTKTYGQAMAELQVALPEETVGSETTCTFSDGILPMSGTTVKLAGKTAMSVDLLRAVVRIDVKVWDALVGSITLNEVQLRNVASVVPYFRTQEEITVPRVTCTKLSVTDNQIKGGLYAVETSLDVSDPHKRLNSATCLLININRPLLHAGTDVDKTWYRINLNVNGEGMQYLKRNNAYTVVITGVFALGSSTPEGAYYDKATLIDAVTVPTDWKSSGAGTPPDVVIQ